MAVLRRRARLFRRWVVAFTLGEVVGFGLIPVVLGVVTLELSAPLAPAARAWLLYLVAVIGGLGEGAVLATFQLRVLRDALPGVDSRRWRLHTALAASLAWAAGMLGPLLDDLFGISPGAHIALLVLAAPILLLGIGGVQTRLLVGRVERPARWLLANVLGWLAGLPFTFLAPALLPDDAPPLAFGAALFVGGSLMGLTTGAITGLALVRLVTSLGGPERSLDRAAFPSTDG